MKSFKDFNISQESSLELNNIIELMQFKNMDFDMITEDTLNEFAMPDINKALKVSGIHIKKGRGLIQILSSAGLHISRIIWQSIKAAGGDEAATEKLKVLLSRKVKKEEIMDVILKLDMITLHALTGPIHAIEAITGWHIWAAIDAVQKKTNNIKLKVNSVLDTLKSIIKDADKEITNKLKDIAFEIRDTFKAQLGTS